MQLYYDRKGKPTDIYGFVAIMEDHNNGRRVAVKHIGNTMVSTVFLGINHNYDPEGPPIIFETMVLGGPSDGDCYRYSTEAEAKAGHKRVVAQVTAAERGCRE